MTFIISNQLLILWIIVLLCGLGNLKLVSNSNKQGITFRSKILINLLGCEGRFSAHRVQILPSPEMRRNEAPSEASRGPKTAFNTRAPARSKGLRCGKQRVRHLDGKASGGGQKHTKKPHFGV